MNFSERTIILLTFLLLIICKGTQAQIIQKSDFKGFQWAFFEWDSDTHPDDIEIQCNCIYRFYDEQIWVIATENEKVSFLINDKIIEYIASPNPHFDKEWKKLTGTAFPTPLTSEQLSVYRSYLGLKMLNQPVPEFVISDLLGNEVSEKDLEGKVSVLNFWFFGCEPCKRKVPVLNSIKKVFEDNDQIHFWAFSSDPEIKGEEQYDFHHFPQARWLTESFSVLGHPTTFVVDKNGIIRDVFNGMTRNPDFLKNNLIRSIDQLTKEL